MYFEFYPLGLMVVRLLPIRSEGRAEVDACGDKADEMVDSD